MSELETASRCGINTVTVVNNNRGLVQFLATINPIYGNEQDKKDEIWEFKDVNFAKIAQETGCFGIRVERPDEIFEAIKMGLSKDVPAVVEVITDMDCKPLKAWRAMS